MIAETHPEQPATPATTMIVGIGASAGSLELFTTFFQHIPPDSGLAFVLIQHLDPDQPNLLANLLASQTTMPVSSDTDQLPILANHVYVIPPNTTLTVNQAVLHDITELTHTTAVLQEAHAALEQRVEQRTSELAAVNATLHAEIAEHRRSEEVRQILLQQLVNAQEEERQRIAHELHDQLGQNLAGLILGLKAAHDDLRLDTHLANQLHNLQTLAVEIGSDLRTLAVRLRPAVLDDLGLAIAMTTYVEQWSVRASVAVDLHISDLEGCHLPLVVESTLYRLVQEALNNVLKHALATGVSIIIAHKPEEIRMIIEDNGCGFDPVHIRARAQAEQRLGLLGMEERVAQIGGNVVIESTIGHGTTVFVQIPLDNEPIGAGHEETTHLPD